MNNICVYIHKKKTNTDPFYVGIGLKYRPYQKEGRNNIWKAIVKKHDYVIEIYKEGISWEEACTIEKELIKLYGRLNLKTGMLCNLTDGGDGAYGLIHSEETKMKRKISRDIIWNGKRRSNAQWFTDEASKRFALAKLKKSNNEAGIYLIDCGVIHLRPHGIDKALIKLHRTYKHEGNYYLQLNSICNKAKIIYGIELDKNILHEKVQFKKNKTLHNQKVLYQYGLF